MKTKKLKILCSFRTRQSSNVWGRTGSYIETPKIAMEGKGLEALGFHIGDTIEVSYEENCIRITPAMVCEPSLSYENKN
ncbi:hypothetical protein CG709_01150 [Lachnotalea glycerini]|nr:hypothetical protein CG709_01150 [Lachnotalea glycerini]